MFKLVDFDYDPERDILDVRLDRVSHSSIPVGGLVIDIDNNQELAGLEILNASENIANLSNASVDEIREILENIVEVNVDSFRDRGMLVIRVEYVAQIEDRRVSAGMPLNVAPA